MRNTNPTLVGGKKLLKSAETNVSKNIQKINESKIGSLKD